MQYICTKVGVTISQSQIIGTILNRYNYELDSTLIFPPPGLCLILSIEPTLDFPFHSNFCEAIFFSPPPEIYFKKIT